MKGQLKVAVLALLLSAFNSQINHCHAQGALTPSSAPSPGMKSLAQIEPRIPISSLPYAINYPGSYYITTNLTGISGSYGLYITSGNVTVDLCGFTLQGVPSSNTGIYVAGACTNIVVCNGNLTGWGGLGVDAEGSTLSRNLVLKELNISGNGGGGIYIGNFAASQVSGQIISCNCSSNASTGISAIDCLVKDCRSVNNVNYGFYLNRCELMNCAAENNSSIGVWLDGVGNIVRGCHVALNGSRGIYCNTGTGGNIIADNLVVSNVDVGIQIVGNGTSVTGNNIILNQSGGIVIYGNNNRIDNNNIQSSGILWGIGVNTSSFTNNVVVRNTVFGSSNNYNNPGNNDFGPIGTAAASTSPWANISH